MDVNFFFEIGTVIGSVIAVFCFWTRLKCNLILIVYSVTTRLRRSCFIKYQYADTILHNVKPEIQEKGELSCQEEWNHCKKPSGHKGFLPWITFSEDPKSHLHKSQINDDDTTIKYIETSGDLVVRIIVNGCKNEDNEINPIVLGSGIVIHVEQKDSFWDVYVSTATHVVFDLKIESKVELFYNSADRTRVKTLDLMSIETWIETDDTCVFKCCTRDEELCRTLNTLLSKQKELYAALPQSENPTAVIISHPHGMHKHISWGPCEVDDTVQDQMFWMTSYIYKATTCKGSSGAPVIILQNKFNYRHRFLVLCNFPCHAGVKDQEGFSGEFDESILNRDLYLLSQGKEQETLKFDIGLQANRGGQEILVCYPDTYTQITMYSGCPIHDHKEVQVFSNFVIYNNFPKDISDWIKTVADLTCKIETLSTRSLDEHGINSQTTNTVQTGTCFIKGTAVEHSSCSLPKSDNDYYCTIYFMVAKHVVPDENIAQGAKIHICIKDMHAKVCGFTVVYSDNEGDWALLKGRLFDRKLSETISTTLCRLYDLEQKRKLNKYNDKGDLMFIISYPYGSLKTISLGKLCKTNPRKKTEDTISVRLIYKAKTFPGSSGAPVCTFKRSSSNVVRRFFPMHTHKDNPNEAYNRSGFAAERLYNDPKSE